MLLHGDGQHAGELLAIGIIGVEVDAESAGGLPAGPEADVLQGFPAAGGVVEVLDAAALGVQTSQLGVGALKADIVQGIPRAQAHRIEDLFRHGQGGPVVGLSQLQKLLVPAHGGLGCNQVLHPHGNHAGALDGLGALADLGQALDEAGVNIGPLLAGDGGGEGVGLVAADLAALIEPVVGQVIVVGDVLAVEGQVDIVQGQLIVSTVQGDEAQLRAGDGDLNGAVLERPALAADAVLVVVVLLSDDLLPVLTVVLAHAGVGAVTVVGADRVMVVGVHLRLNIAGIAAIGACIAQQPALMAVCFADHFLIAPVVAFARICALGALTIPVHNHCLSRRRHRQQHDQRQQQRRHAPAKRYLPFHHVRSPPVRI